MPWFFLGCNRPAELVSPCFEINRHMWYDFYAVFSLRESRNWKIEEYIAAWFFFFNNFLVLFQCSIYASLVSYWVLDWFLPTWSMLKICYLSISSGVADLEWIYIVFLDMKMQKLIWYFLLNNLLFYLIKRNLVKLISNSSLTMSFFFLLWLFLIVWWHFHMSWILDSRCWDKPHFDKSSCWASWNHVQRRNPWVCCRSGLVLSCCHQLWLLLYR